MKKDRRNVSYLYLVILSIPVCWFGLLIAPYMDKGLIGAIPYITESMNHPFRITFCENSLRTVLVCLIAYILGLSIYISSIRNTRYKEEYGSARWGNVKEIAKKYKSDNFLDDKLFTQNMRISFNVRKHRRNLNTLIVGGSGAGKTRFYGKPNIMQCNTSFVVLDPKGEILRDNGYLLEQNGYVIKVIDLIEMEKSHGYNPFHYIQNDNDILKLITNLIRNTTPKGANSADPFWEKSEIALLEALCLYLYHEAPEDEQNFTMVMEMIAAAEVKEDDDEYQSPLDQLFDKLESEKPGTLAYKQYRIYKQAAGVVA